MIIVITAVVWLMNEKKNHNSGNDHNKNNNILETVMIVIGLVQRGVVYYSTFTGTRTGTGDCALFFSLLHMYTQSFTSKFL